MSRWGWRAYDNDNTMDTLFVIPETYFVEA
jgi:hypothetical protein